MVARVRSSICSPLLSLRQLQLFRLVLSATGVAAAAAAVTSEATGTTAMVPVQQPALGAPQQPQPQVPQQLFHNLTGTVPVPTKQHLAYHHAELGVLISSGMGASVGQESSPCRPHAPFPLAADPPPASAYGGSPDPEQWVLVAKTLGAKYATLVAQEMFGFSLWPSKVSNYTVAQSDCKLSKPCDVVGAFVAACAKHGIRPGIFYSLHFNDHMSVCNFHVAPRDLCNVSLPSKLCPTQAEFDSYALAQLKELGTDYGEVMTELWFDGGISKSIMPSLRAEIPQLFPNAVCHSCVPGETDTPKAGDALFRGVRWAAPNEAAHVPYPQWAGSVGCGQNSAAEMGGSPTGPDYCPASGDTVLRQHCWYATCPESAIKPTSESLQEYLDSVGRGANMVIAVAPNSTGLVPDADIVAYQHLSAAISSLNATIMTAAPTAILSSLCSPTGGCVVQWECKPSLMLQNGTVELREDIEAGQRIQNYSVFATTDGGAQILLVTGVTIGHRRIQPFSLSTPAVSIHSVSVRIAAAYGTPRLASANIYAASAWHSQLRLKADDAIPDARTPPPPSCAHGFVGADCDALDLQPVLPCGTGGLCVRDDQSWGGNASTWTGAVTLGDDGLFHMFGGLFSNGCPLMGPGPAPYWLTNALVVHATSSKPEGPYTPHDVSLAPRSRSFFDGLSAQSPAIGRAPDGRFLLFYVGTTFDEQAAVCNKTRSTTQHGSTRPSGGQLLDKLAPEAIAQRIGLAWASDPAGPWTRSNTPIVEPGPVGAWDDLFTADMAPYVYNNGSVLLVYKARGRPNTTCNGQMCHGVAFAQHWRGPYVKLTPHKPIGPPPAEGCEDPYLYREPGEHGAFRLIWHCGCSYKIGRSSDGVSWDTSAPLHSTGWCKGTFTDGKPFEVARRERPQLVLDKNGLPTHISTAVQPHDGGPSWTAMAPLGPSITRAQ